MSALDRKLLRDLRRLWAQGLAIAMVLGAGVATLVLAAGAAGALYETRAAYYDRHAFAHVFAEAKRAPEEVADLLAAIPGVSAVSPRIRRAAIIDIEGQPEPATGVFLSLPRFGEPRLNRPYIAEGRLPSPDAQDEVAASRSFAEAHGFAPGDRFAAILNGRKRELTITGLMLTPEFVYAIGPGDLVPDDRRFGVFFMAHDALAAAFDLDGAFNDVSLALRRDASEAEVIDEVDRILAPYGGVGAYGREDQLSNAFLDAELEQMRSISKVIPPIFLAVAAFLVNIVVTRLIALEREQIGLMKAVGYSDAAVIGHYLKLVSLIAALGVVMGWVGGWRLGLGLAEQYQLFFHFPFLVFRMEPELFAISGAAALAAALAGGANAVMGVARLRPAVAMSPPAPLRYGHLALERIGALARAPMGLMMALRSILRGPIRAGLTTLGLAASIAVMIGALFAYDALDHLVDATYFRAERQHASVHFVEMRAERALYDVEALPGIIQAEPFRAVPVRLVHGHLSERTALHGKPAWPDLSRILDNSLEPVAPPGHGVALSGELASLLDARPGDVVEAELLSGRRRTVRLPVAAVIKQYMGLGAYMEIDSLNRALGDGQVIDGAHLAIDPTAEPALFAAIKETPMIAALALQRRSLVTFRATVAENIDMSMAIYATLAAVIGFGVVYNSVRIQLSERARELASLRVLGFTRGETSMILFAELILLGLVAIPLGWALGWALAWAVTRGLQSELYRVPLIIARSTYGEATAVFLAVVLVSALIARRRIDRLDLVAVLKTRD